MDGKKKIHDAQSNFCVKVTKYKKIFICCNNLAFFSARFFLFLAKDENKGKMLPEKVNCLFLAFILDSSGFEYRIRETY
jgi:hypothetical protein